MNEATESGSRAQGAHKVRGILSMNRIVARASRPFESKRTGETPVPLPVSSWPQCASRFGRRGSPWTSGLRSAEFPLGQSSPPSDGGESRRDEALFNPKTEAALLASTNFQPEKSKGFSTAKAPGPRGWVCAGRRKGWIAWGQIHRCRRFRCHANWRFVPQIR